MKKYNSIMIFSIILYLCLAFVSGHLILRQDHQKNHAYRVESHRIMNQLTSIEQVNQLSMSEYQYIQNVEYIDAVNTQPQKIKSFFNEDNRQIQILPFYQDEQLQGYIKFIYQLPHVNTQSIFIILESSLLVLEIFILWVLFYMKRKILKPFHHLSDLPLEIARGHLKGEIKEEKSKYFGQFIWGIGQLKDTLEVSQKRQLELLKEKKEMLLSLSHDMKTPLNLIKLYSKALKENIYTNPQEQYHAIHQIGEKANEIEKYIEDIMQSSREDILDIQVKNSEFYLKDLMNRVLNVYSEQCALRHIELTIQPYENKLLRGDLERCQEVFENLFENAFKYGDGRRIEISFAEEDYCQLIRVYNTGPTVSDTEFLHIFESFFRGSNNHGQKGSGLGLYICYELMHKMDGAIYAEKRKDGMCFVLVFR